MKAIRRLYNVLIVSKKTDEVIVDKTVVANAQMAALKKAGGDYFDMKEEDVVIKFLSTLTPYPAMKQNGISR